MPGGGSNGLVPEGRPLEMASAIVSRLQIVTPGYFETLRTPLVRRPRFHRRRPARSAAGHDRERDVRAPRLARRERGRQARLVLEGSPEDPRWKEVVGVAADTRSSGPAFDLRPEFYAAPGPGARRRLALDPAPHDPRRTDSGADPEAS